MNTKILKQKILENLILNGNWKMSKIKDISVSIQYGYTGSAIQKGEYKMLRITDIQNDSVDWQNVPYVEIDDKKAQNYLLENDDIVFARTGATVGKSFLIKDLRDKSVFASYLIRMKLKKDFDVQYVKYFFESGFYWQQIQEKAIGTGQPNVNGTLLGELLIPLPPLSVQKSIVNRIERLFAEIDLIETARQELLQLVKTSKQKTLQLAITGELTNADTSTWKIVKLGEVCNQITDGTHKTPKYTTCGIPFLRVTDITESNDSKKFISENEHKELIKRCKPEKGDVLLSKNGTIGVAKVVDWNFEFSIFVSLCLIKPKNELDSRYLAYYLGSRKAISQMTSRQKTVTITNLHLEEIRELLIPLPPLSVQQQIVDKIETIFTEIEKIETIIRN